MFSINTESGKINIRDVAASEIEDILRNENLHYVEDSPLVRAAFKNVKARSKLTHLRNDEFLEEDNAYTLLYQTPITWTKKSNWLSYSRIINWG